jgi:hypothetical protein
MNKVILYCKSYWRDVDRAVVLATSIEKFNKDNLPFYISVPKNDIKLFKSKLPSFVNIIDDKEIWPVEYQQNWVTQQVVKSSFWKLNICENFILLDSDVYFIKDFYLLDFMFDENTPYTVMHEQKELHTWVATSKYNDLPFDCRISFKEDRSKIQKIFGRGGRVYDFGPGPSIWNCEVWRTLDEEYCKSNNLTFAKLIEYCPSEFTWYGEWLVYRQNFKLWPIEPIFKSFHYGQQYIEYKQYGITEEQISQHYLGIGLQSNWGAPLKY